MESVRIAIFDPDVLVCQAVARVLQDVADVEVVGHASTERLALDLVDRLRPRVVLLEPAWPDESGDHLLLQLSAPPSGCAVLGYGSLHNALRVARLMALGALGYVPKDAGFEELLSAIKTLAQGAPFFGARYDAGQLQGWLIQRGDRLIEPIDELTGREIQILPLIAQGGSNAEISKQLGISARTVEIHRANLMTKMHLSNLSELVRFALRCGPLSWEQ